MKPKISRIFIMPAALLSLAACSPIIKPGSSCVLPPSAAYGIVKPCSRPGPPAFEATWTPSKKDIDTMELLLPRIKALSVEKCCLRGAGIHSFDWYCFQYMGLIVEGKKLIYIIIYDCPTQLVNDDRPFDACDGGNTWGVIYDPNTGRFSDLAVNGI